MNIRILFSIIALVISHAAAASEQTLAKLAEPVPAPEFSLEVYDGDGAMKTLEDYRGMPVIVNFWATWCPPCREELPAMNRAWEKIKDDGMMMIGVNVGEDEETIFPFLANYPVEFPILLDRSGGIIKVWPVKGLPTTFVLDPMGRIVYRAIGGREWDDESLLDQVRALKQEG